MKTNTLLKNIRGYKNLPIALWIVKDACWVMGWQIAAMVMIVPALALAFYTAWKWSKNNVALFHNVAVCYWLAANCIWMTGEFFSTDMLRPYAMVLFAAGIVIVASYVFHFRGRNKKSVSKENNSVHRTMMEPVKKVA